VLSQPSSPLPQVPVELPGRSSARLPAATTSLTEQRLLHNAVQAQAQAHRQDTERTEELLSAVTGRSTTPAAAIRAIGLPTIPRWHFAMLNDARRNAAFDRALRRVVRPGDHVLDIGAGTGLLAMMAVRAGASRVTTCEENPLLAEIARQTVLEHGLGDRITVVAKRSSELVLGEDLPGRPDLVVSEIVDCGLIGEGVLPTLRHARSDLLAPGGRLLPVSARLVGCLVESDALGALNRVGDAGGYDVSLLNRLATPGHFPVRLNTWPHRLLSEPVELVRFDFARDPLEDGAVELSFPVRHGGEVHGVVAWFEMDLGGGVRLDNTPGTTSTHWMQAFVALDEALPVSTSQRLPLSLQWHDQQLTVSRCTTTGPGEESR
jgi:predicted nicotinamide N-methyase